MWRAIQLAVVCVAVTSSTPDRLQADIITMDFDTLVGDVTTEYVEDGFRATPIDTSDGINHFDWFDGTTENRAFLHDGNNAHSVRFDYFGGIFDFESIEIEDLIGSDIDWVLTSSSGAMHTVTGTGVISFVSDPAWQDVTFVTLSGGTGVTGNQIHFDNVMFNDLSTSSVPEPTPLALLGVGAISFIGYDWRRKRIPAA